MTLTSHISRPPERPSSRRDRRGVALVITLIFLSVITVMAVAFLALSRRGLVSESEDRSRVVSEFMADTALERAKGEILANILAPNGDRLGPGLMVSVNDTNVVYPPPPWNFNNPNAAYVDALTNLSFDPRPPVFVNTNQAGGPPGDPDFRFFVDLNRNGLFETNGWITVLDYNGLPIDDGTGNAVVERCVGDPEWVGSLDQPLSVHSRFNKFVGRWAFLIQPVGRSLDLNVNHNEAKELGAAGFYRNQGFGTWEINLAAFLADLNTNEWIYEFYNPDPALQSRGVAFVDSSALLNYRYMGDFSFLNTFEDLFPGAGAIFASDFIDGYGNSLPTPLGYGLSDENDDPNRPWPGAPTLTNFYTLHDYFVNVDPISGVPRGYLDFIGRLDSASREVSTYDRYTYYRMLAQIGAESRAETEDRVNINYANIGQFSTGEDVSPTNFLSWSDQSFDFLTEFGLTGPEYFFNAAIDRILRKEIRDPAYDLFWPERDISIWQNTNGIPGIPVVVNGQTTYTNAAGRLQRFYCPRIHQLCQVVANIYDATYQAKGTELYPYYPTVFRPVYANNGVDLWIVGFREVDSEAFRTELLGGTLASRLSAVDEFATNASPDALYYEIPMIVGARKGFPNLNEIASQSVVEVSRKLEVLKDSPTSSRTIATNQMLVMGISNTVALEAWYPYTNAAPNNFYPRDLELFASVSMTSTLTNNAGFQAASTNAGFEFLTIAANTWGGQGTNQFFLVPDRTEIVLSNSVYYLNPTPRFEPLSISNRFEQDVGIFTNLWGLTVTNRLLYALFDVDSGGGHHLIDVVTMSGLDTELDVSESMSTDDPRGGFADVWDITPYRNVNYGVFNQIMVSVGAISSPPEWTAYGGFNSATGDTVNKAIASFRHFLGLPQDSRYPTNDLPPLPIAHQAPFTPTRKIYYTTSWQANDPVVHYTLEDLKGLTNISQLAIRGPRDTVNLRSQFNLNKINDRYKPWGGKNYDPTTVSVQNIDPMTRDPGLFSPDAFEFPTNQFPNVGWLGRVHRGTPWQTLYLKADGASDGDWLDPSGPGYDIEMHPTNDWRLVEYFETALTPEMTRGRLSVNQTNLAAWSAVLSGVPVTTLNEDVDGNAIPVDDLVQPAAVDLPTQPLSPVQEIVAGIAATRDSRPGQEFACLADILAVPELTSRSPYLEEPFVPTSAYNQKHNVLRDSDYEKIPQQILSLLKMGEARFVIYSFGQSLKSSATIPSGPNFGTPTNYEITGEYASRAVVRVDFEPLASDPSRPDYSRPHLVVEKFNVLPVY